MQMAGRKAGIVLDLRREVELSQRQRAGDAVVLRLGPFEDERLQVRAGRIDRGGPAGGAAADDDNMLGHFTRSLELESKADRKNCRVNRSFEF